MSASEAGGLVLVAGVYPPVPGTAADATVAVVRQLLTEGRAEPGRHEPDVAGRHEPDVAGRDVRVVKVVAPRPSAAHFHAPVAGRRAGPSLGHVAHVTGATEVVLCLSRGMPFSGIGRAVASRRDRRTAAGLRRTLGQFPRARVVVAEDPQVPVVLLRELWEPAAEVLVGSREAATALAPRLGVPADKLQVAEPGWGSTPGPRSRVSVSGPREHASQAWRRRAVHGVRWRLADLPRRVRRTPPWLLHNFRVLVGPAVRPVLYRVRAWRAARKA